MKKERPSSDNIQKTDRTEKVLQLLKKIERTEKLTKLGEGNPNFANQKLASNQRTLEVNLPVSYRQLPAIQ